MSAGLLALSFLAVTAHASPSFDSHLSTMSALASSTSWFSACATKSSAPDTDTDYPDIVVEPGRLSRCVSWGWLSPPSFLSSTGWLYAHIETNSKNTDIEQAYAAGYLEGVLSAKSIYQSYYTNYLSQPPQPLAPVLDFIDKMTDYNRKMSSSSSSSSSASSPFWTQVGLVYAQVDGLHAGYSSVNRREQLPDLTRQDFVILNALADLPDIASAVNSTLSDEAPWDWRRYPFQPKIDDILNRQVTRGHCSAFIRKTDDDVYIAHATWADFQSMLRIFKLYKFQFASAKGKTIHMSSYPGTVDSTDDFYRIGESSLTVMETTMDIVNGSLYALIEPNTVPTWVRAMVANRLANTGVEWAKLFEQQNSGTYNNEWMIFDHKAYDLSSSSSSVAAGSLTSVTQTPGLVLYADVSSYLEKNGYWASFNRPFFRVQYDQLGYGYLSSIYGSYLFGYKGYFRQMMFERGAPRTQTLDDVKKLINFNQWSTDPLSHNNSGFSIAARFDIDSSPDPVPFLEWFYRGTHGAIDGKVTRHSWAASGDLRIVGRSGPTHDSADTPPFRWADWPDEVHDGQPEVFNFDWIEFYDHQSF